MMFWTKILQVAGIVVSVILLKEMVKEFMDELQEWKYQRDCAKELNDFKKRMKWDRYGNTTFYKLIKFERGDKNEIS